MLHLDNQPQLGTPEVVLPEIEIGRLVYATEPLTTRAANSTHGVGAVSVDGLLFVPVLKKEIFEGQTKDVAEEILARAISDADHEESMRLVNPILGIPTAAVESRKTGSPKTNTRTKLVSMGIPAASDELEKDNKSLRLAVEAVLPGTHIPPVSVKFADIFRFRTNENPISDKEISKLVSWMSMQRPGIVALAGLAVVTHSS